MGGWGTIVVGYVSRSSLLLNSSGCLYGVIETTGLVSIGITLLACIRFSVCAFAYLLCVT